MTAFKDYLSDNLLHLNARILHLEIADLDEMACDSFLQMRLSTDDVLVFEIHKCSVGCFLVFEKNFIFFYVFQEIRLVRPRIECF